jgi:hypothetical protein
MNWKNIIISILVIVIFGIILFGAVYWTYEREIKIEPASIPVGVVFYEGLEKDISQWDTYINEEYEFGIKHSTSGVPWITDPNIKSPRGEWGKQIGELVAFQTGANPFCHFYGTVYSNTLNLSFKDFLDASFSKKYKVKNYEEIIFGKDSTKGLKVTMERPNEEYPNRAVVVLVEKDSNIITLLWRAENLVVSEEECLKIDAMLSTFDDFSIKGSVPMATDEATLEDIPISPILEEVTNFEECITQKNYDSEFPGILESSPRYCESHDGKGFVEELKKDTISSQANWSTCSLFPGSSETIGSFDCPDWMQDIDLDDSYEDDVTVKFYFYNSIDGKRQRAYLSKETGSIAFALDNVTKEEEGGYGGAHIIKFIYPNHNIVTLYENQISGYHEELGEIKFSPNGEYIYFILNVYDGHRISIINVNTGRDIIFPDYDIYSFSIDKIFWSSDGKYVAIDNDFSGYGGDGSESIFLGDEAEEYMLNKIFDSEIRDGQGTMKLRFDKEYKNIYFSAYDSGNKEVKYKYDILLDVLLKVE